MSTNSIDVNQWVDGFRLVFRGHKFGLKVIIYCGIMEEKEASRFSVL